MAKSSGKPWALGCGRLAAGAGADVTRWEVERKTPAQRPARPPAVLGCSSVKAHPAPAGAGQPDSRTAVRAWGPAAQQQQRALLLGSQEPSPWLHTLQWACTAWSCPHHGRAPAASGTRRVRSGAEHRVSHQLPVAAAAARKMRTGPCAGFEAGGGPEEDPGDI